MSKTVAIIFLEITVLVIFLPFQNESIYIMQAMSVKIETEHNRRWRSLFDDKGLGHVMGSLYWQLNDVWVAPTWSGIDFKGNWKLMQYFSKHFFAPVIVTSDVSSSGILNVYTVSDLTYPIFNVNVTVFVYKFNLMTSLQNWTITTDIAPNQSQIIFTVDLNLLFSNNTNDCGDTPYTNCFLYFTANSNILEEIVPSNYYFLAPLKEASIARANISIKSVTQHNNPHQYFTINISTDAIALFVWLESSDVNISGRFSDNGFLLPTNEKSVTFTPNKDVLYDDLVKSLSITNLMTYT